MCDNDSFNDSDEIFQLYSFKNITKTYKDQLNKLLSNNVRSPEKALNSHDNYKNDLEEIELNITPEVQMRNSLNEIVDCTLDSSDTVQGDVMPGIRRSSRLRKKKECSTSNKNSEVVVTVDLWDTSSPKAKARKIRNRKQSKKQEPEEIVIDDSLEPAGNVEEDINPELSVKVIWRSISIKKFIIRKFQKMSKIYEELSKEDNVPISKIILTFKNTKVNQNDTPSSLNLKVFDFLEGGILSESVFQNVTNSVESFEDNPNIVVLQFRDSNKHVIKIALGRDDKMKIGMIKYSEQLEIAIENIKFSFDGEFLNPSQTPLSLGLENDDIIDITINKNIKK